DGWQPCSGPGGRLHMEWVATFSGLRKNQLRIAAEAFLAPIKAIEVTVCKRQDLRGVVRRYVKDIRPVTEGEVQIKIASSQLAL
ncbi:hypothetical protein, partial [Marinobacter shengliensis]|uniref:hypothetical protein n=1 Tax=Marinobacter shengliensis TaxID=1389223 RepID=UPI0035BB7956